MSEQRRMLAQESMSNSDELLNQAMLMLAREGAIFMGQGVAYPGHAMFKNLEGVPESQRIEWPVCEELQLGCCIGLAMEGILTVSLFPRMDFLLRAMDALVNHLDKMEQMSCGQWAPKVIIRTRVGAKKPLDAGPQHVQNHSAAFRLMLTNINIFEIIRWQDIESVYCHAIASERSSLVVENFV